jgi:hypothetical protein
MATPSQYGWFVWARGGKGITCHKYLVEGDWLYKDSKAAYERRELEKYPLTKVEWELPLSALEKMYSLSPGGLDAYKRGYTK